MHWYRYLVAAMLAFGCAALVAAAPVEDGGKGEGKGDKDNSGEKEKGGKGKGKVGEEGDKKKTE